MALAHICWFADKSLVPASVSGGFESVQFSFWCSLHAKGDKTATRGLRTGRGYGQWDWNVHQASHRPVRAIYRPTRYHPIQIRQPDTASLFDLTTSTRPCFCSTQGAHEENYHKWRSGPQSGQCLRTRRMLRSVVEWNSWVRLLTLHYITIQVMTLWAVDIAALQFARKTHF